MQVRTISSAMTFLYKSVLPIIWIVGFGLATLSMWMGVMHGKDGAPPPESIKLIFTVLWVVGTACWLGFSLNMKRVRIDNDTIYVSNYLQEISVPVTKIRDITENRWLNIHPVTIHFSVSTEFGSRITFMPTIRFLSWRSHPIVAELKQLAGLGS